MLSCVQLIVTSWIVAHQVPLSMKFPRQKYRSRLPFPFWRDLLDPGIKPGSPALQADSLLSEPPRIPRISNEVFHRNTYREKLLIQTSYFTDGKTEARSRDLFCQRFAQVVKDVQLESVSLGQWPVCSHQDFDGDDEEPGVCSPHQTLGIDLLWLCSCQRFSLFFLFPLLFWKTDLFRTCTSSTEIFRICKKTCVHNWGFFLRCEIQRG